MYAGFPNMGKKEPTEEDIRTWIKEGWKFYQRTRKGHVYITRRMGANIERSLGPFKKSLWRLIEKISREPEEAQRDTDPLSKFYRLLERNRAALSSRDCLLRDDEGYCINWRWSSNNPLLKYTGDLEAKKVTDEGNPVYLFLADFRYCRGCPAYINVKMKVLQF